jgi:hypothetical protein
MKPNVPHYAPEDEEFAHAAPLPANFFEREVENAIANIQRSGSSELSSAHVLNEARRRLLMETLANA